MQACKLSISGTHPSKVVKLWLDPISESIALMLTDSSCLIYTSPLASPTSVPPPSSDGAFLRLQPSKPRGRRQLQRERLVFVSAMAGRGGACTILRAWLRHGQQFSPAIVQCRDARRPRDPGRQGSSAMDLDLAHGFAVRIAASVNVFAVYSPSACKIWIMAAKLALGADGCSAGFKKNPVCLDFLKCSALDCCAPVYSIRLSLQHMILGGENGVRVWPLRPLVKGEQRKPNQEKFAAPIEKHREEVFVLPSNSVPGDRIDAVETKPSDGRGTIPPVLKPGMAIRTDRGAAVAIDSKGVECAQDCTGIDDGRGFKNSSEKSNGTGGGLASKRVPRNGVIQNANRGVAQKLEAKRLLNGTWICCNGAGSDAIQSGVLPSAGKGSSDAVESCADRSGRNCTDVAAVCSGVVQGSKLCSNGTTDACLEASGSFGNLVNSTFNECESNISRMRNGQLCPNGTVLDGWYNQQQLSQLSSMSLLSSSASSASSGSPAAFTSFYVPASSSCSSSVGSGTTHLAEATVRVPVSSLSTNNSKVSLKARETLGMASSYFMPFKGAIQESNNPVQGIGKSLRAVSIHALCETKFVVLDSNGDLHLLSLRKPNFVVEDQKEQDDVFSRDNGLRRLNCTMKVKMMAVFPGVSSFTSRRLWVSDGFHSIHVLSFPEVDTSVCESDGDVGREKLLNLSVVQVVFMSDRVRAIAAMSVNAALVLTQGSIIAYSIAGT